MLVLDSILVSKEIWYCESYSIVNVPKSLTKNCVENYVSFLLTFSKFSSKVFIFSSVAWVNSVIFCNSKNQSYFMNLALLTQNSSFAICLLYQSHTKNFVKNFESIKLFLIYIYCCVSSIKIISRCRKRILILCDTCMLVFDFIQISKEI
jgi:hypothetical protein